MKRIIYSLMTMFLLLSCRNEMDGNELLDKEMFGTANLNLYEFVPFTEEEWKNLSYEDKAAKRQIPPDFMEKMTTHELFIQFIHMDMAKDVLLFNTPQQGIRAAVSRFNVLQELYGRQDVVDYFINMLADIDMGSVKNSESRFCYYCLQMLSSQKEITDKMNAKQCDAYIGIAKGLMDTDTSVGNLVGSACYAFMIGISNLMLKYEYEPFMERYQSDEKFQGFMELGFLNQSICDSIRGHISEFRQIFKNM